MQTTTHYIKLFVTFMMMTLFSSHLYGSNTEGKIRDINIKEGTGTITVKSISDTSKFEGGILTHHVILTGKTDVITHFSFSITDDDGDDGTTVGKDYEPLTSADFTQGVTYDAGSGKITVPAGVESFEINVESKRDKLSESKVESYHITIENKTGKGEIEDYDA